MEEKKRKIVLEPNYPIVPFRAAQDLYVLLGSTTTIVAVAFVSLLSVREMFF